MLASGLDTRLHTLNRPDFIRANGTNDDFALARYDPDGNLDLTFGTQGKVVTPMPANDDRNAAEDIVLDRHNRIVATVPLT